LVWDGQRAHDTYSQPDALLAATALVHELGVVTRNTADFERAGLRLLDPWQQANQ
jgi:predicted nucleic acid-binding protein